MLGMEMMFKSLGLDPEEIKKTVTGFGEMILEIKNQLDRIEHKVNAALVQNLTENPASETKDEING